MGPVLCRRVGLETQINAGFSAVNRGRREIRAFHHWHLKSLHRPWARGMEQGRDGDELEEQ